MSSLPPPPLTPFLPIAPAPNYNYHCPITLPFSSQIYTIDRLAQTIVRQLQLLIEESSLDVLGAYERKLGEPEMNYREHVLQLVEDSKVLYKLSQQHPEHVIHVQMIDLAEPEPDLTLRDPTVRQMEWRAREREKKKRGGGKEIIGAKEASGWCSSGQAG